MAAETTCWLHRKCPFNVSAKRSHLEIVVAIILTKASCLINDSQCFWNVEEHLCEDSFFEVEQLLADKIRTVDGSICGIAEQTETARSVS